MTKMKIYIISPDNNKLVTIDDWRKDENPDRADLLAQAKEGMSAFVTKYSQIEELNPVKAEMLKAIKLQ